MANRRQSDKTANKDETTETAGVDQSKDVETTKQAEEKQDALPTSSQERSGETDASADGSKVGAVRDGDAFGGTKEEEDVDYASDFPVQDESVEDGVVGTVVERGNDGTEYEAPYVLVTAESVARTSDSDDPAKDWTAQHAGGEREDSDGNSLDPVALTPVQGTPGQSFRVRELPNRKVVEAAGINYEQFIAGLPVRADVPDEAPRRGVPA